MSSPKIPPECQLCHKETETLENGLCPGCKHYLEPTFLRNQIKQPLYLIKGGRMEEPTTRELIENFITKLEKKQEQYPDAKELKRLIETLKKLLEEY